MVDLQFYLDLVTYSFSLLTISFFMLAALRLKEKGRFFPVSFNQVREGMYFLAAIFAVALVRRTVVQLNSFGYGIPKILDSGLLLLFYVLALTLAVKSYQTFSKGQEFGSKQ